MSDLTLTKSYEYQSKIIQETKDQRYWGLFMEQGTGKTHVIIATMVHLFRTGKIDGVLVLAPNGVHDNWARNEIPLHSPLGATEQLTAVWHGGMGKKKQNIWDYAACAHEAPGGKGLLVVLLANIEAVRTESFTKSIDKFVRNRRFLLVIDESTTIKNPKAAQTKAVFKISKNAAYTRILTGTPITQSPMDLWSQCRAMDELALPYPSFTAFRRMFAVEQVLSFGHRSFTKIVGYQNQDVLSRLIAPFTTRILKKDCLDLPEKIYQVRYVELTSEQVRIYKELVTRCLATVEPGMVTVTTAITAMLRLHQVTLGYVPTDDGKMQRVDQNRISVLQDLLSESTGKTIIFVRFLEDIQRIVACLSETYVTYSGEVSAAHREQAIELFQNGPAKYFIATSAAAKGLTLTAAENVIYYSQGFSLETRLQSEDRAHRIGQRKNVVYTDLIAQGTIDEKVVEALKSKKVLADGVIDKTRLEQILTLQS